MDCRPGCAACCIAPSISSPIPGMPHGKPAGVRCIQLVHYVPNVLGDIQTQPAQHGGLSAAGKAVVGSVEGEPAAILREAGAVVVPPEDVEALAAAIGELVDDEARRTTMAEVGRVEVAKRFDRRVLAGRYREVIASVRSQRDG